MANALDFTGKVVLITGASSGIGAGAAKYLARLNATLALCGRNAENLAATAAECTASNQVDMPASESPPPTPLQIIADVSTDAQRIIDETIARFSRLDVLINCAGIIDRGSIETTTMAQYDHVMDVNMRSVYQLTQLAVPHLIANKGNIVNISSITGVRSFPGVLAYCVSKSAVDQFTKCVALELAAKGVRCNSVNPGVIVTELHRRGGMSDEEYDKFIANCKDTIALGRPGTVEETAKAIAFLASDMASFITGVQLMVDGGRHVMCPR